MIKTSRVKFFNVKKGFGMIADSAGNEDFIHISSVQAFGETQLSPDQEIVYEVVVERGRPAAKLISIQSKSAMKGYSE